MADTVAPITFDNYMAYVNELKKDNFVISKFTDNNIIGSVNVNEAKTLFFSIPFDEGWHVKVNGADAKLYRINAGLTGLPITKGNNKVELTFEPRLKAKGAAISIAALIVFFALLGFTFMRKRKEKV